MIVGTGIDIVEVDRIKKSLEKSSKFKSLVFAIEEVSYCETEGSGYESYAGRFAAKEAFFKALGTGWRDKLAFYEVCVINDQFGKPIINLVGETRKVMDNRKDQVIHLSISHSKNYATAIVIIEQVKNGDS